MTSAFVSPALFAAAASIAVGAVLAGAIALVVHFMALPAANRYALWFVVAVATAAVPLVSLGTSLVRTPVMRASAAPNARATLTSSRSQTNGSHRRLRTRTDLAAQPGSRRSSARSTTDATAVTRGSAMPKLDPRFATGLLALWAIGSVVGFLGLVWSLNDVRALKRRSRPLGGGLEDDLPWLTQRSAGRRETYLRLSDEIETPVAVGFVRPVVFVPAELADEGGLAAIESLIMHEHAHLQRYDDWTNLVARIIERALWFNPAIWFVGRRLALDREIAADDRVVDRTGSPQAYATTLWRLAREMRMPAHAAVAPGAFFTRKQISIRIEALLDRAPERRPRRVATVAAFAAACSLLVAVASQAPALEIPPVAPIAPIPVVPPLPASVGIAPKRAAPPALAAHRPHAARAALKNVAPLPSATTLSPVAALQLLAEVVHISELQKAHQSRLHRMTPPAIETVSPRPASPTLDSAALVRRLAAIPTVPGPPSAPAVIGDHRGISHDSSTIRDLVAHCIGCDLHGRSLRGADLHGLSIVGADLSGVDLRDANLEDTSLTAVNLHDAQLAGASLRRARLTGTDLSGNVSLQGVKTAGLRMTGVSLTAFDLRGLDVRTLLESCVGCDLARADLRGADLHGLHLVGMNLSDANLTDANLRGSRLEGTDLSGAILIGADLRDASLVGASLENAHLRGAHIAGLELNGINVHHLDLSGADMEEKP